MIAMKCSTTKVIIDHLGDTPRHRPQRSVRPSRNGLKLPPLARHHLSVDIEDVRPTFEDLASARTTLLPLVASGCEQILSVGTGGERHNFGRQACLLQLLRVLTLRVSSRSRLLDEAPTTKRCSTIPIAGNRRARVRGELRRPH